EQRAPGDSALYWCNARHRRRPPRWPDHPGRLDRRGRLSRRGQHRVRALGRGRRAPPARPAAGRARARRAPPGPPAPGARRSGGGWLEAHPVAEFPGEDPALALPGAVNAALQGLAHELRNPLAGLKGAAQLLARRAAARDDDDSRELTALIQSEVERLAGLLDR